MTNTTKNTKTVKTSILDATDSMLKRKESIDQNLIIGSDVTQADILHYQRSLDEKLDKDIYQELENIDIQNPKSYKSRITKTEQDDGSIITELEFKPPRYLSTKLHNTYKFISQRYRPYLEQITSMVCENLGHHDRPYGDHTCQVRQRTIERYYESNKAAIDDEFRLYEKSRKAKNRIKRKQKLAKSLSRMSKQSREELKQVRLEGAKKTPIDIEKLNTAKTEHLDFILLTLSDSPALTPTLSQTEGENLSEVHLDAHTGHDDYIEELEQPFNDSEDTIDTSIPCAPVADSIEDSDIQLKSDADSNTNINIPSEQQT